MFEDEFSHLPLLWADLSSDKTDTYVMEKKDCPTACSIPHHPARQRQRINLHGSSTNCLAWILHLRVLHNYFINILLYVPFLPTASPILALDTFNIGFKLVITTRCARVQLHHC